MLHSSQRLQMSALEVELGLPRRINSHVPYAVNRMGNSYKYLRGSTARRDVYR
jgi:hypothetical protein